jgi:hypothetical protein
MKEMITSSGGIIIQSDTFANPVFKDSIRRVLLKEGEEGFLGQSSNAVLEVWPRFFPFFQLLLKARNRMTIPIF